MIKNVYGNSQWLNVSPPGTNMPYINTSQPMAGMLRMNPNMNRMEVYDGTNWLEYGSTVNLDLSEQAKETLRWAYGKMSEERQLKELMDRHPGLKDLNDKLEMMKILCLEEEKAK